MDLFKRGGRGLCHEPKCQGQNKPKIMEASKAESTGFDATDKLNCLQQNIQDFT